MTLTPGGATERLWCQACGTVTADQLCDCNRWGKDHEMFREPNFVNYADAMQEEAARANSKLEAYRKALEDISRQKTTEEIEAEEEEYGEASGGDVDGAYDAIIGIARKALAAGG